MFHNHNTSIRLFTLFMLHGGSLLFISSSVSSTDITWTPGNDNPNDAAAKAPKSQKYWDENNIPKPEYAKTDAEVAQERGINNDSRSSSTILVFLLIIAGIVGIAYAVYTKRVLGGDRLGGNNDNNHSLSSVFSKLFGGHRLSPEDARKARLAKFETSGKVD